MRRVIRLGAAALLAIPVRPAPGIVPGASSAVDELVKAEAWYTPAPQDFRPEYDRDARNRAKQTWDQYWTWVKAFYEGNFFTQGWTGRAKGLLAVVRGGRQQERLRSKLNVLGRGLSAEWAKDYDIRQLSTADLVAWGRVLEKAKAKDDGQGTVIDRTIESIRAEIQRKRRRS
jgi:hypothetical protein